jgi:uncharacterized protein (DUF2235 family)
MNIIVCCDGTWNTPNDLENGVPSPTNVVKLYNALAPKDPDGAPQKSYYHPGVGSEGNWRDRILGGSTGKGLNRNIKNAYCWLAGTYQPGDKIWLFGFSRGAYTARSLGGMISRCGLLDLSTYDDDSRRIWDAVDEVFEIYRMKPEQPPVSSDRLHFHNANLGEPGAKKTPIRFIGVWDTVGSLGIPDDLGILNLLDFRGRHEFHDAGLSTIVATARHALAIDEMRQNFIPTLWTLEPGQQADLKQVWFAGAHGDVGGGYAHAGLSDIALKWMIDEAREEGLEFRPDLDTQINPHHHGVLHNSVSGFFRRLKTRPRSFPLLSADNKGTLVHESVLARRDDPPLLQGEYRTLNWDGRAPGSCRVRVYAKPHWNWTGIYLRAGTTYKLSAEGEWLDKSVRAGPDGVGLGIYPLGRLAHLLGTLIGLVERGFGALIGNHRMDAPGSRRHEDLPWFSLVGLVANDQKPARHAGSRIPPFPHETFLIGSERHFTPTEDGYLYCFANDAWQCYNNNHGSVRLTVSAGAPADGASSGTE